MRRIAVSAIFASLFLGAGTAQAWWTSTALRDVASSLTGRDVGVRCMTDAEADRQNVWGAALVESDQRMLAREWVCVAVQSILSGDPSDEVAAGEGLLIFIHETGHLRGWRNEAKAERYALRRFRKVALRLGVPHETATRLLGWAVDFHLRLPRDYRTQSCRYPFIDTNGHLRNCR